ncbi:hypothetical protein SEUCBS139899_004540 [Sporothrix eucalyptigena]
MADWVPSDMKLEVGDDGVQYARDEDGNQHTRDEIQEMQETEKIILRSMDETIAKRDAAHRAAHAVAFSIPQSVYDAAAADPEKLSAEDRALILSRGDLEARALVDPHSLTRAERHQILGWPAPEVVEKRIRAATKATGNELSTPKELFAKAEREGVATLTPDELQLIADQFHLRVSDKLLLFSNEDSGDRPGDPWMLCPPVPGRGQAMNVVWKLEGLDRKTLVAAMFDNMQAEHNKRKRSSQPPAPRPVAGPGGPDVPGQEEAGRVIDEIADALVNLQRQHVWKKMSTNDFFRSYDSIVASLRGFALRFNANLPPTTGSRIPRQPDPIPNPLLLQLGPNPFGIRLSHDGRSTTELNRFRGGDGLPAGSTQAAPWTVWSPIIPHHIDPPSRLSRGTVIHHEEYVAMIQEWTDKEEQAWRDFQQICEQTGQQQEAPLFFNTPPEWPHLSHHKRPFNIYLDEVMNTEEAQDWDKGEINYAKTKWDAMTADEQAVYKTICENERKQAWINSMHKNTRPGTMRYN